LIVNFEDAINGGAIDNRDDKLVLYKQIGTIGQPVFFLLNLERLVGTPLISSFALTTSEGSAKCECKSAGEPLGLPISDPAPSRYA
jgi:hypothetical protein